uniref:Uncharacterized protein n=1 Tax=Rhizophora mucronata TaxID=61149 RepID=A0A2P2QRM7_RHIMU
MNEVIGKECLVHGHDLSIQMAMPQKRTRTNGQKTQEN